MSWSQEDQRVAFAEGWGLFNNGQEIRLERLDDPRSAGIDREPLDCDADAWRLVWERAQSGSGLHRRALAAVSARERKAIEQYGRALVGPQQEDR